MHPRSHRTLHATIKETWEPAAKDKATWPIAPGENLSINLSIVGQISGRHCPATWESPAEGPEVEIVEVWIDRITLWDAEHHEHDITATARPDLFASVNAAIAHRIETDQSFRNDLKEQIAEAVDASLAN